MKKTAGFLGALAALALLASGNAMAQQGVGMERLDVLFQQIDLDASGTLTVPEMRAAAAARFNALDINGDGVVHANERNGSRDNRLRIGFGRADRNGDGMLDAGEMQAVARQTANRRLASLDRNGDGMLSLEEMQAGEAGAQAGGDMGPQVLTLATLDAQMMALFRRADTNRDGVVTLREAIAGAGR